MSNPNLSATPRSSAGPSKHARSVARLHTDDQVLSHHPPSPVVQHKGARCAWDQGQQRTLGMIHVQRSFGKVILVYVKIEDLK